MDWLNYLTAVLSGGVLGLYIGDGIRRRQMNRMNRSLRAHQAQMILDSLAILTSRIPAGTRLPPDVVEAMKALGFTAGMLDAEGRNELAKYIAEVETLRRGAECPPD